MPGGWALVFNGDRVSVEEGEKFRRWMMVRVAGQGECTCYLWLKQYVVTLCDFYHNRKKNHKWLEVEWILLKIEAVTWRIAIRKYQTGAL